MDLRYSDADLAFRAEIRAWLDDELAGEWGSLRGSRGSGPRPRGDRRAARLEPPPRRARLDLRGLADGARRARAEPVAAGDLPRGVRPVRRAGAGQPPRRGAARTDPDRLRHRRAAGSGSCRRSSRSRSSGPRATPSRAPAPTSPTCRPGRASTRGGRVGHRRAEGLDLQRPLLPVDLRARPHRARLAAAPGPVVPARAIDQAGVDVRPIEQLTGGSEFNEVFLTGARTDADLVVGEPGKGWGVAMGLLGFERGVSTLAPDRRLRPRARRRRRARKRQRRDRRPGAARPARRAQGRARGDPRQRPARAVVGLRRRRLGRRRGSGLDLQARLGQLAPPPRRGRDGRRRVRRPADPRRPATSWTSGSGSSSSPAPTPSTAAATRSRRTSWPSACSAFPVNPRGRTDDRPTAPSSPPLTTSPATTCCSARWSS